MNSIKKSKRISYFKNIGKLFHHVHVKSRKLLCVTVLSLLLSLKPSLAKDQGDILMRYIDEVKSLRDKGIVVLNHNKEFRRISDKFIKKMRIELKKAILQNEFEQGFSILNGLLMLGNEVGDSTLVESLKIMKKEMSAAHKIYHEKQGALWYSALPHNRILHSIGEISVKGEYWEFKIKKDKGVLMGLSIGNTLADILANKCIVKVARQEVKDAINKHSRLNKEQKQALENKIIGQLKGRGLFEG